jgi:diguanylate cyclase (GGDEF)-like protein
LQVVQEPGGPDRPRVLLVEDDPQAAMAIGELLREIWPDGLIVSHARRVADAAHEMLEYGATCVVVSLPAHEDPTEILRQLGTAAPHIPIIALSDSDDQDREVAAVRAGAQDHLRRSELTAAVLSRAMRFGMQRKRSEVVLTQQALHDPLTGLPNRTLFLDRLRVALDRSRRTGAPVVVLFLDVDGFKEINDSLGHPAGDTLLTVLADRFRGLLRPMDTVARFGGDEFTFLFEGLQSEREAMLIAQRISRSAGLPLPLPARSGEDERSVAVSIGVTMVTDPSVGLDEIIREADVAMYRAKDLGGARAELTAPAPARQNGSRAELEAGLRQAIAHSELRVHYQPKVKLDHQTGLVGFEALVRWEHPDRGLLAPAEFIDIAEDSGLIVPIGDWVLAQGLLQIRRWRRARPDVTLSVNVSERQFADPRLADRIAAAVRAGGEDPGVLCLDVAEGAVARAPEAAARQFDALHELGVRLAIDDFGTAAGSPEHLRGLPVDTLKIDRSLVSALGRGRDDVSTLGAAVSFGRELGLTVVAEGVETDTQLAQLRELGVDGAQGFLFSRPMTEAGVSDLLASR